MPLAAGERRVAWAAKTALLPLVAIAALPGCARAQISIEGPSVALSRPVSVRSAGLNGAGAALVGNAGAVFSNPAGIATIRHIGIEAGYRTTPSEGSLHSGALAWRIRQFDLGVGVARYRFGSEFGAQPLPGVPTDVHAREYAGVGTLVYRFGIIALAGSGKYVRRLVDDVSESAFSGDAGLAIAIFDIVAIGFSMQNIGGRWGGYGEAITLPGLTRLAMMWNYVDPLETFRLLSTVEIQWPDGADSRIVLGGEGGMVFGGVGLFARAAYATEVEESIYSSMSYGGSVTMSNLAFDYAYQEHDLNGIAAHRFGFRLSL
mgnify:CR=1 FL=1